MVLVADDKTTLDKMLKLLNENDDEHAMKIEGKKLRELQFEHVKSQLISKFKREIGIDISL